LVHEFAIDITFWILFIELVFAVEVAFEKVTLDNVLFAEGV